MIEIDHTAVPPPEPAIPILASNLLAIEEQQRKRFSARGARIRTGCGEIDDYMLRGGCERGIALGISAEAGEARLLTLHLLSSILISHLPISSISTAPVRSSTTKAIVIDTTGSFPISVLAKILKTRILECKSRIARQQVHNGNNAIDEEGVDAKGVDAEVRGCLEMVAISRVFDIEGLWEVLGEVGRDSESGALVDDEGVRAVGDENGVEMIIIDNMTHLINELFARKGRGEAHTLLETLSRALRTQTHTRNILTILHNTTVSSTNKPYQADPSLEFRYPNPNPNPGKQANQTPQPTSIFPSSPLKPALGQVFSQFPDLHLLISTLPKTRADAEQLYGQDDEEAFGGGEKTRGEVGYCYVVEVLKDETPNLGSQSEKERSQSRFGGREQRWAAVEISPDGLSLIDAFMAKGNLRGLGLEREKGGIQDVGNVAKIYGFGGRRV